MPLKFARNRKRFEQIVTGLAKYGLADWIKESDPDFVQRLFRTADGEKLSRYSRNERIRMALTELGTTFIKLGQVLSTRPDLVGPELARELEQLQSSTPADASELVRETVQEELGAPPEELFAEFDDEALASASIGQVHRARLADGTNVVVKVQHHGIEDKIVKDLDILTKLASLAAKHNEDVRLYRPEEVLADFRRNLLRELDFGRERRNLEQFTVNFEADPSIHFPVAYPDLSSRRVLTMEQLDGYSVAKGERLEEEEVDTQDLARRGANAYLEMIFRDGYYHADPHPGNIWVLTGGRLGFLDAGMVGRLDDVTREVIEDLVIAWSSGDVEQITELCLRLGKAPPRLDRDALRTEVADLIAEYQGQNMQELDLSQAINALTELVRRFRIVQQPSIMLLGKVLVMLEGTFQGLSPDFNLTELLEPYTKKIVERRLSPQKLFGKAQRSFRDWERLIEMLPREMSELLLRMREGTLEMNLHHRRLDSTVNRLIYGILVAALILASAAVLGLKVPPLLGGVSVFGLAGIVGAAMLGIPLVRSIAGSGGLGRKK